MRSVTTLLVSLSVLGVVALAHALPKGEIRQMKKVRAPTAIDGKRLGQTVRKNGQTLTRQQIIDKFDPSQTVDLGGGKTTTVQDLLDRVDASEKELAVKGSSLTALKKTGWFRAGTASKLAMQKALVSSEQSDALAKRITTPAFSAAKCGTMACTPKEKEKSVKWDKTKGDEDTIAVYTSFGVTEQTPNVSDAKCIVTWDNGVQLMGDKHSLVKVTAEASGSRQAKTSSGKAALYVLGQATPTWSKDGPISGDNLDRTFKTPKAKLSLDFIPLVSVEGGIEAAATLSLKPTVGGEADATHAGCSIAMTPRLTAEINPEVKIVVGLKKLVEIAEGGVRAQLTAVDVSFPTTLGLRMDGGIGLKMKSDVKASFLKGKVVAWYKIKDVCILGGCLIEDGLGIDTSGEIVLWQDDVGIGFDLSLADYNGAIPIVSAGQSVGMGSMAR